MNIRKNKGITLIALIITIIVMLIISAVAISALSSGGLFSKVSESKMRYDLSVIKEEIDMYALGQQMDQKSGIDLYPVLLEDGTYMTMDNDIADKNTLPDSLKQQLMLMANTAASDEIPTVDDIDYTQFYKIDTSEVQSATGYGDLYLYQDSTGYKVISISGITLSSTLAYIVIPWNDMANPQYIATSFNTYKLYGDGTLKVVGQYNALSGATTQEVNSFNGVQEFKIPDVIPQNISADSEEGKVNWLYFNMGTALVVDKNNDLWAWGDNNSNKLGLGYSYVLTEPILIAHNVAKAWCSINNSWYLTTDNKLYAAGDNSCGTLGQGNTNSYIDTPGFVEVTLPNMGNDTVYDVLGANFSGNQGCIILCNDENGKNDKVYGTGPGFALSTTPPTWNNVTTPQELFDYEGYDKIVYDGNSGWMLKGGKVYATGDNQGNPGKLGIGSTSSVDKLTLINSVDNVDDIALMSVEGCGLWIKTVAGELYATYTGMGDIYSPYKVTNNLYPDMKLSNSGIVETKTDGKLYRISYNFDDDGFYIGPYGTYTNATVFDIDTCGWWNPENGGFTTRVIKADNKIYIDNTPNITTVGKRSITSLKTVFNGAAFVQGMGSLINIATMNGEIYEGLTTKNTDVPDVVQVLLSAGGNTGRYALTKDGELWAKGNSVGAWGTVGASVYTKVSTGASGEALGKVKKIFVMNNINSGSNCVFITENDRIYWMGRDSTLCFVGAVGTIKEPSGGYYSSNPKDLTDSGAILSGIADKIKDIEMSSEDVGTRGFISTFIVTTDGQLYSMEIDKTTAADPVTGVKPTDFKLVNDGSATSGTLGDKKVIDVKITGGTIFAVTEDGNVYTWGYNYYGLMGAGFDVGTYYNTPMQIKGLSNIKSVTVSTGGGFAIFVSKFGQVWGIGANSYGQLGDGTTTSTNKFIECKELEK